MLKIFWSWRGGCAWHFRNWSPGPVCFCCSWWINNWNSSIGSSCWWTAVPWTQGRIFFQFFTSQKHRQRGFDSVYQLMGNHGPLFLLYGEKRFLCPLLLTWIQCMYVWSMHYSIMMSKIKREVLRRVFA